MRILLKLSAAAIAGLFAAGVPSPLMAQGVANEDAIETIVDAPVSTEEKQIDELQSRIADAIKASTENARQVRKLFSIDKLDIVFVPELANDGMPLADLMDQHADGIEELRTAIEGSAMFYHAVDSRSVQLRDVIAVEIGDGGDVTIFAAGQDPES